MSLADVRPQLKGFPVGINIDTLVEQLAELPVVLNLYNTGCVTYQDGYKAIDTLQNIQS